MLPGEYVGYLLATEVRLMEFFEWRMNGFIIEEEEGK